MNATAIRTLAVLIAALALVPTSAAALGAVLDLSSLEVPTLLGAAGDEFGYSSAAGDIDGDSEIDILVGAPGQRTADGEAHSGAVYIFGGTAVTGLGTPTPAVDVARCVIAGDSEKGRFGETIVLADLDGDSIDDIIIAAPSWGRGATIAAGRVYVFFGPFTSERLVLAEDAADVVITGNASGDRLGSSIAAGDIDRNGGTELLVSAFRAGGQTAPWAGAIYVIDGGPLRWAPAHAAVSELARATVAGKNAGDALRGIAIADTDGDNQPELVMGAYHADGPGDERIDTGEVYILPGDDLANETTFSLNDRGVRTILGSRPRGFLGRSIAAGDVDDDGADDLVISAYASRGDAGKAHASGEVFVIFGGNGGIRDNLDLSEAPVPTFRSRSRWDLFGLPVATADVNGDLSSDVIIAAQFADSPDGSRRRCGEVYVYWGGLRSVIDAKAGKPDLADLTIVGAERMDALGGSLLTSRLTGAPTPDLIIGAPNAPVGSGEDAPGGKLHLIPAELVVSR